MNAQHPGFSQTGSTWIGHHRGTREFSQVQLGMLLAGIAAFAQLYAPQAVLPEIAQAFQVTAAQSALMVSMATGGLAVAVVPWSLVADRFGRKRTMTIAVVAATVFALLASFMPTFELALAARLLEGIALGGVPAVAMAYINEEIHPKDAIGAGGTFVAGNTIGGLSGRLITGPVAEATGAWQIGFLSVAALSAIASVLFIVLTPKPQGFVPMRGKQLTLIQSLQDTLRNTLLHLRNPLLLTIYLQPLLLMGGFVALYNYLGYHLTGEPFNLPVWLTSLVFLAYLSGTFASPPLAALAGRLGRKRIMITCDIIGLVSLAALLIPNVYAVIIGLIVFTGAFFASHSIASGWAGALPKKGRAQSTSLYTFCYYMGSSIFGFLGGIFYQTWGWLGLLGMITGLFVIAMTAAILILPGRKPAA